MKLLSAEVRGAIGIRDGLGIDTAKVDFNRFAPGIIAVVGNNGAGKTTFIENLHFFRRLASRKGALQHHFFSKDSFRNITAQFGEHTYRAIINIDGQTDKQEGFLYRDDMSLNMDGKTTTFDTEVEKILGSEDMYFFSVFSAQGAESLISAKEGKKKELFYELLGMNRYEQYVEACKVKIGAHESDIARLRGRLELLQSECADHPAVVQEIERLEREICAENERIAELESNLAATVLELTRLEGLKATERERRDKVEAIQKEIDRLSGTITQMGLDFAKASKGLDDQIEGLNTTIARKRQILEHATLIDEKLAETEKLEKELVELGEKERVLNDVQRRESDAKREHQEQLHKCELAIRDAESAYTKAEQAVEYYKRDMATKAKTLFGQLEQAKKSSALIDEVPCNSVPGLPEQCKLLSSAMAAKASLPELEKDHEYLIHGCYEAEAFKNLQADVELAQADVTTAKENAGLLTCPDFTEEKNAIGYDAARLEAVTASLATLTAENWKGLKSECQVAQSTIEETEKLLTSATDQRNTLRENHNEGIAVASTQLEMAKASLLQEQDKLKEVEGIDEAISAHRINKSTVESAIKGSREDVTLSTSMLGAVREKLHRIDAATAEIQTVERELACKATIIENWRILQTACSKDGIPALELDAAGPELSRIATELLTGSFGIGWGIRFETQRLSSDKKKMIEDFRILCYTPKGEKDVSNMSGGEKVWVIRAIADAFAYYNNKKRIEQGKPPILTRILDEVDGQLDDIADEDGLTKRNRYWMLVNESHRIMGLHHTIAITHDTKTWSQIPQRIHFDQKTGSVESVY